MCILLFLRVLRYRIYPEKLAFMRVAVVFQGRLIKAQKNTEISKYETKFKK